MTGAAGRVAHELVPALVDRGWDVVAATRDALDITDPAAVRAAAEGVDVVVNTAAWADLARCERDEAAAHRVNAEAVGHLARVCEATGAHLLHVSTDYVFDGTKGAPYVEDDPVAPLSAYARSKLAGERAAGPSSTVVRTAWVSGTVGSGMVTSVLARAADPDAELAFVTDQWGTPTSAVDLARVLAELAEVRPGGVVHASNAGVTTRHEIVAHVLAEAGHDPGRVRAVAATDLPSDGVVRPRATPLADTRLAGLGIAPLRPWRDAYADLVRRVLAGGPGPARR